MCGLWKIEEIFLLSLLRSCGRAPGQTVLCQGNLSRLKFPIHRHYLFRFFVQLPIKIDIIKHKNEIDGKSTAVHAAILAPEDVKIYTYPNIPDYRQEEGTVLIFPTPDADTVASLCSGEPPKVKENYGLPKGHNIGTLLRCRLTDLLEEDSKKHQLAHRLPVQKAVFIDSTWSQCRGIYKDERVACLKTVVIQNRISQFWRHQKNSPR